jgi:hypothetical protein
VTNFQRGDGAGLRIKGGGVAISRHYKVSHANQILRKKK